MQELQTAAADKLHQSKIGYKKYYDRHINEETFKPGDAVFRPYRTTKRKIRRPIFWSTHYTRGYPFAKSKNILERKNKNYTREQSASWSNTQESRLTLVIQYRDINIKLDVS